MKKWLFNPFVHIAGGRALLLGLLAMAATAVIGYFSHTHFDGVIDIHTGRVSPFTTHVLEQMIDWLTMTVVFYLAGVIFSGSKIRLIDVAGTMALARWVMIFPAIIGFGIRAGNFSYKVRENLMEAAPKMTSDVSKLLTPQNIALSLLCVVFSIWMIALMYNAFSVSCNMKGGKAAAVFTVSIIVTELIAFASIHNLLF